MSQRKNLQFKLWSFELMRYIGCYAVTLNCSTIFVGMSIITGIKFIDTCCMFIIIFLLYIVIENVLASIVRSSNTVLSLMWRTKNFAGVIKVRHSVASPQF